MKLNELTETLGFRIANRGKNFDCEITGGYTSDLLSDVVGSADAGMIWITLQTHCNVIAVASLKELAAILLIGNAEFDEQTLQSARDKQMTILTTEMSSFEASGRIYEQFR